MATLYLRHFTTPLNFNLSFITLAGGGVFVFLLLNSFHCKSSYSDLLCVS